MADQINFRGDFKLAWQKLTRELKICDHSDKTDGYRGSNKEYTSHLKLAIYYSLFNPSGEGFGLWLPVFHVSALRIDWRGHFALKIAIQASDPTVYMTHEISFNPTTIVYGFTVLRRFPNCQ